MTSCCAVQVPSTPGGSDDGCQDRLPAGGNLLQRHIAGRLSRAQPLDNRTHWRGPGSCFAASAPSHWLPGACCLPDLLIRSDGENKNERGTSFGKGGRKSLQSCKSDAASFCWPTCMRPLELESDSISSKLSSTGTLCAQIRTLLHLPLTLLALRLRLRVRPQPSWPHAAAVAVLTLLPTRLVAVLERRARRCFLASLPCRPVSAGVPPRRRA